MPDRARTCPSCDAPLPEGAGSCPGCGAASPAGVRREPPDVVLPPSASEESHRARLARALGDNYELGRLLGRGGFAEVHAARDRALQRDVAVKTLRFDLPLTPVLAERFQREAQAMAKLRHPNLMPVYSVGQGEGIAFFVMPLAQGESLREVLEREHRVSVAEARRILAETAAALGEAHRAGMVHRDVKPDNIMLEGDERRVLLMDLGIAKAAEASETAELTGTGMIVGTPHYMSPEQASGERHVDHRADLYSLGVVGFQMLTGRLPFTAPTVQGVIVKHISEEVPSRFLAILLLSGDRSIIPWLRDRYSEDLIEQCEEIRLDASRKVTQSLASVIQQNHLLAVERILQDIPVPGGEKA